MYSQLFGSFLLRKGVITPEQLSVAISKVSGSHIKLGTLAIHNGYMAAPEVDEVCFLQTREDKRFGELAIERGYLTEHQVRDLLKMQTPDFLLLGQVLVDEQLLTNGELETLIIDYQSENEITDMELNSENMDKVRKLIEHFFIVAEIPVTDYSVMYMELLFNNLVRFIGDDFTPLTPIPCSEYPVSYCVTQAMDGNVNCISRIEMSPETAVPFASRYAKEDFTEFDEYVQASLEDFINLHNGLFIVNMSNEHSIELQLEPPVASSETTLSLNPASFVLPITYTFGTINFIVSLYC